MMIYMHVAELIMLLMTEMQSQVVLGNSHRISDGNCNKKYWEYIEKYYPFAVNEMLISRIPASITLAQGLIESGEGNSELAIQANNHFGIKCHENWAGPSYVYDDDKKNECFRKYHSALESYSDHTKFLLFRSRYSFLFDLKTTDYKSWARGLRRAGYATDPQYGEKLIEVIEKYKLNKYDSITNPVITIPVSRINNGTPADANTLLELKRDSTRIAAIRFKNEAIKNLVVKERGYLELNGKVQEWGEESTHYKYIDVFTGTTLCASYKTSRHGKIKIKLPLHQQYTLVFSEPGHISKKIQVNTEAPSDGNTVYKLKYVMYLFEEIQGLDIPALNQPVAYISLNDYNQFDYDEECTFEINRMVERTYFDYYLTAGR